MMTIITLHVKRKLLIFGALVIEQQDWRARPWKRLYTCAAAQYTSVKPSQVSQEHNAYIKVPHTN